MKILIWQSYGEIDVYELETVDQYMRVTDEIRRCCKGHFVLPEYELSLQQLVKMVNTFSEGEDDMFERLIITNTLN